MTVEPTPATSQSLDRLEQRGYPELRRQLREHTQALARLVPTVAGLSVCKMVEHRLVTLVATTTEAQHLDAMQYLDGGPCATAVDRAEPVELDDIDDEVGSPLSEQAWSLFARASAAVGVRASLSLPLLDDTGEVVGSVNIYASQPGAFAGVVAEVADLVGAWAPGAVGDADLSFDARARAVTTSRALAVQDASIVRAIRIIAHVTGLDEPRARQSLIETAARAGEGPAEIARGILLFHEE